MRNKIWNELSLMKYHYEYLILYLDWHKKIRKWVKIITTIFSASGVFGWAIFKTTLSQVACTGIALIQILTLVEGYIYLNDESVAKGAEMRLKYAEYLNKLEELWHKVQQKKLSEDELATLYFELKNNYGTKILEYENKIDIKHKKKLMLKADKYMRDFLELLN